MEYLIFTAIFIFGAIIGSFLNMLIYRLPLEIPLLRVRRSICQTCKSDIIWYENIPLVSFFVLKGKCSKCHEDISFLYPVIEFGSGFLFLFLFLKFGITFDFVVYAVLFSALLVLSIIDFKYKAVPDYLLLFAFFTSIFLPTFHLENALIFAGAFVLLDFFVTFYIQNIKSRITKNDNLKTQKALGEGDLPIVAIIGGVLGVQFGLTAIILASLIALIPALYVNFKYNEIEIPFIPFLSLGLILTVFFGQDISLTCCFW